MLKSKITVTGYGSLLSAKSARSSFPRLTDFRPGIVKQYKRVFNKVGVIFVEKGLADWETMEVSSCSTVESSSDHIQVSIFEIPSEDFDVFFEREHRFRHIDVKAHSLDGLLEWDAIMCTEYSDEEYREERFINDEDYYKRVGHIYDGVLWRDDILPCRTYLKHCLGAAKSMSDDCYDNFLDHSYLADKKTTIREYLTRNKNLFESGLRGTERYYV